jgi:flagellar biosynthesis protein FlhB
MKLPSLNSTLLQLLKAIFKVFILMVVIIMLSNHYWSLSAQVENTIAVFTESTSSYNFTLILLESRSCIATIRYQLSA